MESKYSVTFLSPGAENYLCKNVSWLDALIVAQDALLLNRFAFSSKYTKQAAESKLNYLMKKIRDTDTTEVVFTWNEWPSDETILITKTTA